MHMKRSSILLFALLCFILIGCSNPQEKQSLIEEISPQKSDIPQHETKADNSQTSVDWAGTYFNVLPCASCEGIETWLTLYPTGKFELKTNYLGLNDAREEIFTGTFEWDSSGSLIQLKGLIGDTPGKYKVGENRIWHLDQDGNKIGGTLADRYILTKK